MYIDDMEIYQEERELNKRAIVVPEGMDETWKTHPDLVEGCSWNRRKPNSE